MDLFTTSSIGNTLSEITSSITANIEGILIVFGFIVGLSIVMALIDGAKEGKIYTEQRNSRRGFNGRKLP